GFGAAVVTFPPARARAGIQSPLVTAAAPAPAAPLIRAPREIARSQKCACPIPRGGSRCRAPLRHRSSRRAAGCPAKREIVITPPPTGLDFRQSIAGLERDQPILQRGWGSGAGGGCGDRSREGVSASARRAHVRRQDGSRRQAQLSEPPLSQEAR